MSNLERFDRWIKNGEKCPTCRGSKAVLAHRPTIYCTDSDEEIRDAYRMAERACPDCPDFAAIYEQLIKLESPCK